jgi:hypothetical protein
METQVEMDTEFESDVRQYWYDVGYQHGTEDASKASDSRRVLIAVGCMAIFLVAFLAVVAFSY